MNTTIKRIINATPTPLLRRGLFLIALAALSGCGQKGPLVLEQIPADQIQAPLENEIDRIPVESTTEAATEATDQEASAKEQAKPE